MAGRVPNPYRPGFNQTPPELAGRDKILAAIDEALAVAALDGRTPRPLVMTGARGVGKTVILAEAAARAAEAHSWLTVAVEARPGASFLHQVTALLLGARDAYRQTPVGTRMSLESATVRATVLGMGGEIAFRRQDGDTAQTTGLETALTDACTTAMEHDAGIVITIDELQLAARTDLAGFIATLQQHVPDDWPLVVILAGLPSIRRVHRGVTYLERAEWHAVGLLGRTATVSALQEPARSAGRPMTDEAARRLANASGGYPYAIQLMGHHAWRASTGSETIEAAHVRTAVQNAEDELADGLYAARWEDASEQERAYLTQLAALTVAGDTPTGPAVAASLGRPTKAVSYLRDRLIQKGTVFADSEALRFAIPGMASWIDNGST
jgi:hypothetical protein